MCSRKSRPPLAQAARNPAMTAPGGSMKRQIGNNISEPMMVMMEKVFAASMFLPIEAEPMTFFEYTALPAEPRLDSIAAPNPSHVKLNSLALASATPPMMGSREAYTGHANTSPMKR
mmetsp:Transcript_21700/g.54718  ORF Transcript_21700/g.54718 Transcript_21700/m.54718 type:complete len:117 (-) Transcript_21700:451-801(-)